MGKAERGVLFSFITVSVLSFAPNVVRGASISVDSPSGAAGSSVTITVSLAKEGAAVAGEQNDIAFDPNTPVATKSTCLRSLKACTSDADCPDAEKDGPCMTRPDCTANPALITDKIEVFFGCTGTNCAGMRAIALGFVDPLPEIPDGAIYSCKVNIAAGATGANPVTLSRVIMSDKDGVVLCAPGTTGQPPVCGATNGTITVGTGPTSFLVCDVAPSTGDNVGQFGNNTINNTDVVALFKASLQISPPPAGTARFSAMDAAPADTPPTCGGNSSLVNSDVVTCFKRSLLATEPSFSRALDGTSCTSTQVSP
jgi:hypothetical protein